MRNQIVFATLLALAAFSHAASESTPAADNKTTHEEKQIKKIQNKKSAPGKIQERIQEKKRADGE